MDNKSEYKSLGEWCVECPADYAMAKRNGHIDKICEHFGWARIKPSGYWNKVKCQKEALKYKTSSEWKRGSGSSYQAASSNGWLNECSVHFELKNKPPGYWTKEKCLEEALNHNTKAGWERCCSSSHSSAKKNGWFDECVKHMESRFKVLKWTKKLCIKEAKKYSSKSEWRKSQRGSQLSAIKNGWYDECTKYMK